MAGYLILAKSGVVAYQGPGDIVTGAQAWWGLRAYNAAYATGSNPAIDIVKTSDGSASQTINILSDGTLDVATIAALGYGVSVSKIWDQSGRNQHLVQATLAKMPTLTLNAIAAKSRPAMTFATSVLQLAANDGVNTSQPYSGSLVSRRTGNFTTQQTIMASFGVPQINYDASINTVNAYAGAAPTATASDSTFHALDFVFAGAASLMGVDGTSPTVDFGSTDIQKGGAPGYELGEDGAITGSTALALQICEGGWWLSGFTGPQISSLATNKQAYWGY